MNKFNITLKELQRAATYAHEHGVSEFKTICIERKPSHILGAMIVAEDHKGTNALDITEYESA